MNDMNIIEIATLLSVETSKIGLYTAEDFAAMANKLELEKHSNKANGFSQVLPSQFKLPSAL